MNKRPVNHSKNYFFRTTRKAWRFTRAVDALDDYTKAGYPSLTKNHRGWYVVRTNSPNLIDIAAKFNGVNEAY
jgi:hypothetical protein